MAKDESLFPRTRWTVVRGAAGPDSELRREAMGSLCERYWPPLLLFARRQGLSIEEAEDATQDFFARLLDGSAFQNTDAEKGSFRAFISICFKRHLTNRWRAEKTIKRGGRFDFCSWDLLPEGLFPVCDEAGPEVFDRDWALTVIGQVRQEMRAGVEHDDEIDLLEKFLPGGDPPSLAKAAGDLDVSEGALKVRVHRFRKRFSEGLRRVVSDGVDSPEEVAGELKTLLLALQKS